MSAVRAPMPEDEHRALAAEIDTMEERLKRLHDSLRASQRPTARPRHEVSKALAALRALRLSMVEQFQAETVDHAREAYFR